MIERNSKFWITSNIASKLRNHPNERILACEWRKITVQRERCFLVFSWVDVEYCPKPAAIQPTIERTPKKSKVVFLPLNLPSSSKFTESEILETTREYDALLSGSLDFEKRSGSYAFNLCSLSPSLPRETTNPYWLFLVIKAGSVLRAFSLLGQL